MRRRVLENRTTQICIVILVYILAIMWLIPIIDANTTLSLPVIKMQDVMTSSGPLLIGSLIADIAGFLSVGFIDKRFLKVFLPAYIVKIIIAIPHYVIWSFFFFDDILG